MYGVALSLGILVSSLIAERIAKKNGLKTEIMWEGLAWAIVGGVLGARIYHVLDYWKYYSVNPHLIPQISKGGLGIIGALVGGALAIFFYIRKKNQPILFWFDIAALVTPIGQAIGRWGNFFNQELFGLPTTLPWGLYVRVENRPEQFTDLQKFHPLFLYESILNLTLFFILITLYKRGERLGSGLFLGLYIIGYSTVRFLLENLRIHRWYILGLDVAQVSCFIGISLGYLLITKAKYTKRQK